MMEKLLAQNIEVIFYYKFYREVSRPFRCADTGLASSRTVLNEVREGNGSHLSLLIRTS